MNDQDVCYSADGEIFHSDLDGVMDDMWNCQDNPKVGDKVTIYQGVTIHRNHKDYLDVTSIIEDMCCRAYDDLSDFTDGYLVELEGKLAKQFEKVILEWLDKNIPQPHFHGVKDVKEIEVTLRD